MLSDKTNIIMNDKARKKYFAGLAKRNGITVKQEKSNRDFLEHHYCNECGDSTQGDRYCISCQNKDK